MQNLLSMSKRIARQTLSEWRFPYDRYMHRHRCVFVHIPKTAGTSLRNALGAPKMGRNHFPWWVYHQANPSRFASYFSFAFVRDPVERLASGYRYLLGGGNRSEDLVLSQTLQECADFDQFVVEHLEAGWLRSHPLFWPQAWFVADHFGDIRVDFLGRLENIEVDYQVVRQKLGLRMPLPRQNTSSESSGLKIGPQARSVIRRIYSKDYELFAYD